MPTTETEVVEVEIAAAVDDVWELIGDFGGIGFMPGIDSVDVDGDTRTIHMGGMEIVEELVKRDEDRKQISYSIVGGVPIESHEATISVVPAGDGCRVSWAVTAAPEGTAAFMASTYESALKSLKKRFESD